MMSRGRLRTENGTVLTDTGVPLRGGVAEVFRYGKESGRTGYSTNPAYYTRLRRAHLNAVRVVCSDPWQRSNGYSHWELGAHDDREAFLAELDTVVQLAIANHLYVLMDYHDIGRLDLEHAYQFWDIVAPRYAAAPQVFYELANEPVSWHPEHYTDDDLSKQELLFRRVRSLAPDTHLVMLSFANTAVELVPDGNPIIDVLERIHGIDWTNASVGIHPYRTLSGSILLEVRERAPVVMTELDLPAHAGGGGPAHLYTSIDAAEYGHQVMERHGISWFGWGIEGFEKLEKRFERGVLEDARSKNYIWPADPPLLSRVRAGSVVLELFREPALRDVLHMMGVARGQVYSCVLLATLAALLDGVMLLLLLPISQGAAQGSFEFVWRNPLLAILRPHIPAATSTYTGTFLSLALLVFGIGLAKNGAHYGLHLYVSHLYRVFSARLANAAFRRYLVFGKPFFDKHSAGETASILDYNHDLLNLLKKLLELVSETLVVAIYLAVMIVISWKLTVISLLVFPAMYLIRQWIARRTRTSVEQSQAKTLSIAERSFEIHRAMPLFRTFTLEEKAARDHAALAEEIRRSDYNVWLYEGLLPRAQEVTTLAALLLVLIVAFAVERGQVAELFVFFFISRLALPRLSVYHEVELEFSKKLPRVRRFLSLFNDNAKYITAPGTRTFTELQDAIYFQKLTFSYPDRDPVLRQVSCRIPRGKVTAIVGPSGTGKTTLVNLLLRHYDVAPHSVALDGRCIREFLVDSLRRQIAVVSQDVILLDDTLRANIVLGVDGEVSETELNRVIHQAALTDVVQALPVGLDTPIGWDGMMLSGGQRQRVALARALLKGARILILDEATSSLDAETEQFVQTAIENASVGCTILLISHRLATIRRADQVVVLENGRVVESGGLHDVLGRNGAFFRMWQAQRFDWEDVPDATAMRSEA
jgi:subfamily B ATP-binding cassette protein MsbA